MSTALQVVIVFAVVALLTAIGFYYLTRPQWPDQNVKKRAFTAVAVAGLIICLIAFGLSWGIWQSLTLGFDTLIGWVSAFLAITALCGTRYARP